MIDAKCTHFPGVTEINKKTAHCPTKLKSKMIGWGGEDTLT